MKDTGKLTALPVLPLPIKPILDEILRQSLGASLHIRRINDLFCAIANYWETSSSYELIACLLATGDFFIETRGRNTPAVSNAIQMILRDLSRETSCSVTELRDLLNSRREKYNANSLRNVERIATYGANLLADYNQILAFDYSSTMMAILKKLADQGLYKHLVVTEGRDLCGGLPIVKEATSMGHTVHFVLDMAFHHYLGESDGVLIGAETIFANGNCWNTVGSFPIAVLSQYYHVPFYVATELMKIDARSYQGIHKPMVQIDYSEVFGYPSKFEHPELVTVSAPNLDNVPASLISCYITERGVMPPENIWGEALLTLEAIGAVPLL